MSRLIDAEKLHYVQMLVQNPNNGKHKHMVAVRAKEINEAPTVEAIPIPKGATNGDMIKALFPNIEVETYGVVTSVKGLDCNKGALDPYRHFWSDWWNAPYKENEDGSNNN